MDLLESIRCDIRDFAGYQSQEHRRVSDEQIRAFVGEALASLPDADVAAMPPEERAIYDRLLVRAEFINQQVFRTFDEAREPQRVDVILAADCALITAAKAKDLAQLEDAFDRREEAMQQR